MRKRFEQQFVLGRLLIQDTPIPTAKRSGSLPSLLAALKEIFITPEYNEKVFEILEEKIYSPNNNTGRPGMDLWQIFVLSQIRLCQNLSYDVLHYMANYDSLIRQLLGIEKLLNFEEYNREREYITYQNIIDNVSLLDDETVKLLNEVIVSFGHKTFKKKEAEALSLKTDSFVVESNVHFPTDYNLLWDSARKCLDMITALEKNQDTQMEGWRKKRDWYRDLKNKMRAVGKASSSGGKGKAERLRKTVEDYLKKAKTLLAKLEESKNNLPPLDEKGVIIVLQLDAFIQLLDKHIDLLERRVLKGETIPHQEKLFSIFEQYTEWVTKGKMRPNIELGKKVSITTDQYHLVVDYYVMENESDSQIVPELSTRITSKFSVNSWSFDKGYWHKKNKGLLSKKVEVLVMPKKGKCNKLEAEAQSKALFKRLRNKHSTVESNINELEHRGLDRCPDKGYPHFKRYVGLAISAYNLKKIGEVLIEQKREKERTRQKKLAA